MFGFQNSSEDVGVFQITVIPRPEATLTELEVAVDQVLQKFIAEGPTAEELQKAKSGLELNFLRGLESNLGKAESTEYRRCFLWQSRSVQHRFSEDVGRNRR